MRLAVKRRSPAEWDATARKVLHILVVVTAIHAAAGPAKAQDHVSFPTDDGGLIHAVLYGTGERAVVLAHGGRSDKESWSRQAREIASAGFRVMAFDFRGYGLSRGPGQSDPLGAPLYLDVLAAVRYLRHTGAEAVAVVGASMGGSAAGDAAVEAREGEIGAVVFLSAPVSLADRPPEKVKGRKLFIMSRDDTDGAGNRRLARVRQQYERTPGPKRFLVLDGSAHAQFIFDTPDAGRVMREILQFLATL